MGQFFRCVGAALLVGCASEQGAESITEVEGPDPYVYEEAAPFALVELFTSEGCDSCPDADVNLGRLADAYSDERVLTMEWHVDYWDYLGWEDPYGSERFSDRQTAYAVAMGNDVQYTPQMVVNAEVEFNGASVANSDVQVAAALEVQPRAAVSLWSLQEPTDDAVLIEYDVVDAPQVAELNLVLVQSGLSNTPDAGENRGVELQHTHVVRRWKQLAPERGEVELKLPPDGRRRFAVYAWVQHPTSMRVTGASKLDLDGWFGN